MMATETSASVQPCLITAPGTRAKHKQTAHRDIRIVALQRFAIAITLLNIFGYAVLGFEPPFAAPFAALTTAYILEIIFETIASRSEGRPAKYRGGLNKFVTFLLPAHITALAISMLLFAGPRLWPIVFATSIAISSKAVIRITIKGRRRHFLNPSNFGITITLIFLTGVGLAPPYQFTKNLLPPWEVLVPLLLIIPGLAINRLTKKIPVFLGWVSGFIFQALLRILLTDASLVATLIPLTGMPFILFSFYMVTDPSTTPNGKWAQASFGIGVALVYGLLAAFHIAFGMFLALVLVCCLRGLVLYINNQREIRHA